MKKAIFLILCLLTNLYSVYANNEPARVAVVDTGISINNSEIKKHLCKVGHKDFTGEGLQDINGHGTFISSLIISFAKRSNYCLVILKYYSDNSSPEQNFNNSLLALEEIKKQNITIVNYSGGGPLYKENELNLIKENPKTKYFTAAGNEGRDLQFFRYYPASYSEYVKNIVVVGALSEQGNIAPYSNYGSLVKQWELGTVKGQNGTSISTAIATGKFINVNY